ncbi:hypothetical protein SEA_FUZZBUSTER_66 [Microbacterium phage FuzzBuster]|uniref:Uncharacterized protein n=1 Tax=Microbacterium phage FuzzBuster TaxID=2590935 RepID=A0A516KV33_9CAUD|nr:hypothetical protein SEA_FUZZBUSTER_66 [Microbacterium phage FuzzBuster]
MGYRVLDAEGELIAGDDTLDDVLKASALLINGWIVDEAGEVVYDSPGHVEAVRRRGEEAERVREEEAERLRQQEAEE